MSARALHLVAALGLGAVLSGCADTDDQTAPAPTTPPASTGAAPSDIEESPLDSPTATAPPPDAAACDLVTPLTAVVSGEPSARYAGIYAASREGDYRRACLDVTMAYGQAPGPISADPASPQVAFWTVPQGLSAREAGDDVSNVAQIFQRSGLRQVSWAEAPIAAPADFRDRRVGLPTDAGLEVIAATSAAGLDPVADVTFIAPGGYRALLGGEVDAAAVQSYDGYVRLLNSTKPTSGATVSSGDVVIVNYQDLGWGLLADGIWANGAGLSDAAYLDATQRFVTATLRGWIRCRDDISSCAQAVNDVAPNDDVDLQRQMIEQANALIWPSPAGIGAVDQATWDRTVAIGLATKSLTGDRFITAPPTAGAFVGDMASAARDSLAADGLSVTD